MLNLQGPSVYTKTFKTGIYSLLVLFVFSVLLNACKNENSTELKVKNNSEITIKGLNGHFLSADQNQGNQILANRSTAGSWETFSIEVLSNNKVRLRASDFTYVGSDPSKDGQLFAGNKESVENIVFTIQKVDSISVVVLDYRNNYLLIDQHNAVRANEKNLTNASRFILKEMPALSLSHFKDEQLIPLIIGLVFLLFSLITFQYREDKKLSLMLLILGGFSVRLFAALLNSYLSLWDEQFHALVAKNMMEHPFEPMLYKNHVIPYDPVNWISGHIWLHKQPLFLWQMALSMKIFGVNIFALRLPSVLMSTAIIYFIYQIGKISLNKSTGYYGAVLFATSNFAIELTAGVLHTDHNDIAFLFYLVASIWAWVEYENCSGKRKKIFLVLIGLFSGCAILVKWLTGLLVFSGWGLSILLSKERRTKLKNYLHLLVSFGLAILVFLPWQLYILTAFPMLSRHEYALNSKHFVEVIEGHGGDFWWHFANAGVVYGLGILFIIFCFSVFFMSLKNAVFKIAFLTYVLLVYVFFSIAATKMIAFTYSVSFLLYLSVGLVIAVFFERVIKSSDYLPKKTQYTIYTSIILCIISGINLDVEKIQEYHTLYKKEENSYLHNKLKTTPHIRSFSEKHGPTKDFVLFNCRPDDNIPFMFFNDLIAAYSFVPDSNTLVKVKEQGHKIAVFDDQKLPSFIIMDQMVEKIPAYWLGSN